tara:strand:- start:317 stop:1162 length:846 start_codon:yes stop_codon:yes gene_type:complete
VKDSILDPLAKELIDNIEWLNLPELSSNNSDLYPVAMTGEGSPLLLIHGFDSCFLEFRRLYPLLKSKHQLIIPDLFGFGFTPRPKDKTYGLNSIIIHLKSILNKLNINNSYGVIGASMGGAIAMKLAREMPERINKLLLLSPAGLWNKQTKIPWPLDQLGVCILHQPYVRKRLCRQALANKDQGIGLAEEQIASIHLAAPGWRRSLAEFARNGGVSNCGSPIPSQPLRIIYGLQDNIITTKEKEETFKLLKDQAEEINECGHLPHLDQPQYVAKTWLEKNF